jgi:N-acetylglutamate synthase-like GNAT family acetyltransferase
MLTLRPAGPDDVPAVAALVRAAFIGYVPRIGATPAPMSADHAAAVAAGHVRVAVDDAGAVVGVLVLVPFDDHLLVETIAVAPDAHGTGIGSRLLALADDVARDAGLAELRLYTNELMTENLAYYQRRGFVETHRASVHGFRRVFFSRPVPP